MTKRILALVMAVLFALTCSLMVACSDKTTTEDKAPATSPEAGESSAPVVSGGDESKAPVSTPAVETPSTGDETPAESPSTGDDDGEPEEMYSTAWLEWLTNVDMGDTYNMAFGGGLYGVCDYDGQGEMLNSAWELWPYTVDGKVVSDNTHFHLCLTIDSSEFNGIPAIGTEDYEYRWDVYYRLADSTDDYTKISGAPWGAITHGDNYLYRFDLYSCGFRPVELTDTNVASYHMIFMIYDSNDELVIWRDEIVDWTDSSAAFLADGLEKGIVKAD